MRAQQMSNPTAAPLASVQRLQYLHEPARYPMPKSLLCIKPNPNMNVEKFVIAWTETWCLLATCV